MKSTRLFLALSLLLLLGSPLAFASSPEASATFQQAVEAYEAGDYARSQTLLNELTTSGIHSANLYYNLGNTQFRLNEPGQALASYERALLLDPGHAAADRALLHLRRTLALPDWDPPTWWAIRLGDRLAAWTGAAAFWIAVFALASLAWPRHRSWKTVIACLGLLWAGLSAAALFRQWETLTGPDLALVTARDATARTAPAETGSDAGKAPPGSPIKILAERDGWVYAKLDDGRQVWFPENQVERIRF